MSNRLSIEGLRRAVSSVLPEVRAVLNRHRSLAAALAFAVLLSIALYAALLQHANQPATLSPSTSPPTAISSPTTVSRGPGQTPGTPPTPAIPATAPPASRTYQVVAGDTLATIALHHGVGYPQLAADNQLPDPNRIRPGQLLRIGPPALGVTVIQPGDTLSGLAKARGLSVPRLLTLNAWITNQDRIPAGGALRVRQ